MDVASSAPQTDQLTAGSEAAARRSSAVFAVVIALAVAVALLVDAHHRDNEATALLAATRDARVSADYVSARVSAMVAYTSPVIYRADNPARLQRDLEAIVQSAARDGVPALRRERARVAALAPWPWHGDLRRGRAALLVYLDTQISFYTDVGADLEALYSSGERLRASRDRLRLELRDAVGGDRAGPVDQVVDNPRGPVASGVD